MQVYLEYANASYYIKQGKRGREDEDGQDEDEGGSCCCLCCCLPCRLCKRRWGSPPAQQPVSMQDCTESGRCCRGPSCHACPSQVQPCSCGSSPCLALLLSWYIVVLLADYIDSRSTIGSRGASTSPVSAQVLLHVPAVAQQAVCRKATSELAGKPEPDGDEADSELDTDDEAAVRKHSKSKRHSRAPTNGARHSSAHASTRLGIASRLWSISVSLAQYGLSAMPVSWVLGAG